MLKQLQIAGRMLVVMTLLTGVVYPLVVTGIAQGAFPRQANGSLLPAGTERAMGSELIGQSFSDPRYFWGRPSATSSYPYNASASGGSNLGPTNPVLLDLVKSRVQVLQTADPTQRAPVPVDLVTASASGLDPHISPAAADYQIGRVARERGVSTVTVQRLVSEATERRQWGVLGEPRVHVLRLNLALDTLAAVPDNDDK